MNDKKPENPKAFPRLGSNPGGGGHTGMTLRDYFAGQAVVGLLSHYGLQGLSELSINAYLIADDLLKERSKP